MKRYDFLSTLTAACCLLMLFACAKVESGSDSSPVEGHGRTVSEASYIKGIVNIKVSESLASQIEEGAEVKSLDDALSSIGAVSFERLFPHGGEFEPRMRKAGLHRWYKVSFDRSMSVTKAGGSLSDVEGVDIVEYRPRTVIVDSGPAVVVQSGVSPSDESSGAAVFDDPRLGEQWHYYNDGSARNTVAGMDINVVPVWMRYTTGSDDVVVAVVDGGIDGEHEDLAANLWTSTLGGREVHGRNFVNGSYDITPHDHGTHVAGTVAAVNNNGIGVSGVAGGNYAAGVPGVRLMSCQIFQTGADGKDESGPGETAIVWAANNGAVIAQNSWTYSFETEEDAMNATLDQFQSTLDAIDYFTKYAGTDADGNQVGPMKGGLVIFAAGNDSREVAYPAMYEGCLSVTSLAADRYPAYYTNYGDWADVAAPGGDAQKGPQVLSTLPGNSYGLMQGTSMACPHVSGIAALLVSYYGGPGFTSAQLREMIEKGVAPLSTSVPMGKGLVNTLGSFEVNITAAPSPVQTIFPDVNSNSIDVRFLIPEEQEGASRADRFRIYYSASPFGADGLSAADSAEVSVGGMAVAGDTVSCVISGLEFDTPYYIGVAAVSYAGNRSDLSQVVSVTTGINTPPQITPSPEVTVEFKDFEKTVLEFQVYEADRHAYEPSLTESPGASLVPAVDNIVKVQLSGPNAGRGSYSCVLTVTDEYGLSSSVDIHYTVKGNEAPEVIGTIENMIFNSTTADKVNITLSSIFSDPDVEELEYVVEKSDASVVRTVVEGGNLAVSPISYGETDVTVKAYDAGGLSCSLTFRAVVRDGSRQADFYPNPVTDLLNIRTGETVTSASVSVRSRSGALVLSQELGTISPFAPAQIDMTSLSGGMYDVTLTYTQSDGTVIDTSADVAKL